MPHTITHTIIEGFDAVEVTTDALALTLIPELGGKVSSLRDTRTGREWLWRNPRLPYRRVPHGSVYVTEADTGGWDECFPSVAACAYPVAPWQGVAVQDHGELWSQAAELDVTEDEGGVQLHTHWQGIALPYRFERTLTVGTARVRAEYVAVNEANAPMPFIWCIHPLLAIEPGMQLLMPPEARFHRWASVPTNLLTQDSDLHFPLRVQSNTDEIDFATLPDASAGVALKLWSDPLENGWATLRARDGELQMRWDVARGPQVAFWLNCGAWATDHGTPYYNLGLEPCIGAQDSLAEAVTRYNNFAILPPNGSFAWWLEIELTV